MIALPYLEGIAGLAITVASARSAVLNSATTPIFDRLLNSTVAVFGFWLAVTAIPAMLPVLVNTNVSVVAKSPGLLTVDISAFKIQNCLWIDTEAYVVKTIDDSNLRASVYPEVQHGPGVSRPLGLNDFGRWDIKYNHTVNIHGLLLRSRHECGHRWQVITNQGPFLF